jgi:hypothetical protein
LKRGFSGHGKKFRSRYSEKKRVVTPLEECKNHREKGKIFASPRCEEHPVELGGKLQPLS